MKADTSRLSKETLSFLAASVAFSAALYGYLVSEPLLLRDSNPISTDAAPSRLCAAESPPLVDVAAYLHGERNSPFEPLRPPKRRVVATGPTSTIIRPKQELTHLGSDAVQSEKPKPSEDRPPSKSASDLRFAGTVFVGAETRALLLSRDNCSSFSVKPGDAIPEYGCTVTRIRVQSIHLADSQQQPVVLNDGR